MPRMNILNTVERGALNSPPVFSSFQRKQYFDFPSKLRRFAADLRNPAYQLGFLLSAGYFKAVRRFFSSGSFHPRDIEYVARQLEPGAPAVDFAQYHPRARQRHQHTIRTFYGFRACYSAASRLLLKEIAGLVRSQVKPKVIFWRCIDVLVREKIEVPSYTRLTKLILGAINRRSQELAAIIERSLTQEVRTLLEDLLTQDTRRSSSSRAGMTLTSICTSSPSSRTSFTGFRTTRRMCFSPAIIDFEAARFAMTSVG